MDTILLVNDTLILKMATGVSGCTSGMSECMACAPASDGSTLDIVKVICLTVALLGTVIAILVRRTIAQRLRLEEARFDWEKECKRAADSERREKESRAPQRPAPAPAPDDLDREYVLKVCSTLKESKDVNVEVFNKMLAFCRREQAAGSRD